ncbi:3'-5' exonuclease [Rickettsia conorii subsp. heilongjiangensis]|uniref:Ribonuclease D n=3 Tax=spotted fever group TaxID=114277 RepID=A0AAD1CAW4_RICJA|nr:MULTISPECIES: ribonuclease D [spotted fever group]AEK74630.1 ribonuclease D [Rickettsia conorii subsp. heilongjiangensis 054]AXU06504.1 ribonuclease D [Rickettsia japonica]QHE25173.1 ribonuclease D [Rickettsia japonica]UZW39239.1 ribonuclease D [Rickettsia conorii subsp. heilongjiangensis]BAK96667.1 ribonuclease D [Rickettsia japonica YH]
MTIKIYQNDLPNNFELEGDLAIDTETMGLNLHRDKLCLLQFSNGNGEAHLVHFTNQDYTAPNVKALLLDKTRCKIFHFARFDLASIKKYLNIDLENIFCTKISSKLVRTYTDSHGLKDLCRELLNINISKQQQSSYWGADNLSSEQKEYAAKDVLYLHQLKDILQKMLLKENRYELAQDIFRFLPIRANLDLIGWNEIDIFMH